LVAAAAGAAVGAKGAAGVVAAAGAGLVGPAVGDGAAQATVKDNNRSTVITKQVLFCIFLPNEYRDVRADD
jgi:hypothetical protein